MAVSASVSRAARSDRGVLTFALLVAAQGFNLDTGTEYAAPANSQLKTGNDPVTRASPIPRAAAATQSICTRAR